MKQTIFVVVSVLILIFITLATIRFVSGEDDWYCQNGQWTMHGHPNTPAPQTECK